MKDLINRLDEGRGPGGDMVGEALIVNHPDLEALLVQHKRQYEKLRKEGMLQGQAWNRQFDGSGLTYDIKYLEDILDGLKAIARKYGV